MGAGASAADGRIFCHGCGSRSAYAETSEVPQCATCGATEGVEVTDARLPVTSTSSAFRALSIGAARASSSIATPAGLASQPTTVMRVESVTVVALERPEDGGLLLRVLPNVVARTRESVANNPSSSTSANLSNVAVSSAGMPNATNEINAADQEDWEMPSEPACESFVSRLRSSPHDSDSVATLCVICAEDIIELGTPVVTLSCQHIFHDGCIKRWLNKRHTCPTCRLELEVDDVKYLRSIGLSAEADAMEQKEKDRVAKEQLQQAAERKRWVESMCRGESVHFGLTCNICKETPIIGECFRCHSCENHVLCKVCLESKFEDNHTSHEFYPFGVVPTNSSGLPASSSLLTVLVPPVRHARTFDEHTEPPGQAAMAAAEVAFAAVRSLAIAPLVGGASPRQRAANRWTNKGRGRGR